MDRKEDFMKLVEEMFNFYNSDENRGLLSGQPINLKVYDIQYLIYKHIGEDGGGLSAISNRLKKYIK